MNEIPSRYFIDTHCHLDFNDFEPDRDDVIKRSSANGVSDIIVPAVSQNTWHSTIELCEKVASCHLALGLHPVFIEQHQPDHLNELDHLVTQHTPVAIGEIGLDFYLKELDREKQLAFFSKQLVIAQQHQLPVIIHNRKAHDECISLLKEHKISRGIIHAFNGSIQQAEKYYEMGFALGFGGMLTFERSTKLRALVKALPIEAIVLETDAPDMTVAQHRGERNSPEYIPLIADAIANIRNISVDELAQATSANALRVLNL